MTTARAREHLRRLLLAGLCLIAPAGVGRAATVSSGAPPPTSTCTSVNTNFWAYNRCTYNDIHGKGIVWQEYLATQNCPADTPPGSFPVVDGTKLSYRFTLVATPSGTPSLAGAWIYYTANYPAPPLAPPMYIVSLYTDSNGRPNVNLGSQSLSPNVTASTTGWQFVSLSSSSTLQSGDVYHLVVEPDPSSQVPADATHNVTLVSTRTKCPVPYVGAAGQSGPPKSPFDSCLAVMRSDSTTNYVVEGEINQGYDPIFAVDVVDGGNHVLVGQPYDDHQEHEVWGSHQYGQTLTTGSSSETLNYVAFFLTGWDFKNNPGCPNPSQHTTLAKPAHDLLLTIMKSDHTVVYGPRRFMPGNYGNILYFGRLHWFGQGLVNSHYQPTSVTLAANTTYYFVLSAPTATGENDPVNTDGWRIAIENSTLGVSASQIPTFLRDQSVAITSSDGGVTFSSVPSGDMGFVLGWFEGGIPPLAIMDDASVTASCLATQVHAAPPLTDLVFGGTERNIGTTSYSATSPLYMMLRNPDDCSAAIDCNSPPVTSSPVPTIHDLSPNTEDDNRAHFVRCFAATRLLLELGHFDTSGNPVLDDLIPWEVRNDSTGCH